MEFQTGEKLEHVQREEVTGLCSTTHYKGSFLGHTLFHFHTNDTKQALTKFGHGKTGDTSDLFKGKASIWRAPGIGWHNLVKFDEDKVLHQRLEMGIDWLDDKDLGVQVGKLSMSPQCSLAAMEGNKTGLFQQEPGPETEGNDSSPSLSTCQTLVRNTLPTTTPTLLIN